MKNRYRIVRDNYAGFECQIRYWWFPVVWCQIGINTNSSIEEAERFIWNCKNKLVKYVD